MQLRKYLPRVNQSEREWNAVSENLIGILKDTIRSEIKQKKNAYKGEGKELKTVSKAIEQFVPEYTSLRVKRVPRPHMLISKGNNSFNLDQLSDGEKNLITLIGDIARRLAIANPNSKDPLKGDGIILIDEIDLHLHPSWQRLMIPGLSKVFPNCQFIITTHSPLVLSHVRPESIFLLINENNELKYSSVLESFGKNADRILEDVLGVDARPIEEKKQLHELFRLIQDGEVDKAKVLIEKLRKLIGEDQELVKANVLIKRKQIIGK
jgi:predicted ATP-binding protein involved in virulence